MVDPPDDATHLAVDGAIGSCDQRIGADRLVRELGQGGMGTVYLAVRDDDAFQKRVALKGLKRGMDTDALVRRFRTECQILAALDHPNIARLFDGGTTADGLPHLVMEAVGGGAAVAVALVAGVAWQARVAQAERAPAERRFDDGRALANAFLFDVHDAVKADSRDKQGQDVDEASVIRPSPAIRRLRQQPLPDGQGTVARDSQRRPELVRRSQGGGKVGGNARPTGSIPSKCLVPSEWRGVRRATRYNSA